MRKWKLRGTLAVGLVALLAASGFELWPRPDRVTKENFDRIREGMSRAEVAAILGPPGDYRTGPTVAPTKFLHSGSNKDTVNWKALMDPDPGYWQSDSGDVDICFEENFVCFMQFTAVRKLKQSPLDNLLWRANRQWRKWFP